MHVLTYLDVAEDRGKQRMDTNGNLQNNNVVSYLQHESEMARLERVIRRQFILIVLTICLLVGTNACWLYYEQQFEEIETTVTQENADGYNNYIGNDGDINNGETNDQTENQTQENGR